jgi:large subunit ribosomal protein L21e
MKRSKGRISRKSRAIGRKIREEIPTPYKILKEIEVGKKVLIKPYGKFEDFPHMRYAGRTGRILEKRGNAYVIEIKDGEKVKKIIASPIHLKVIE